MAKILTGSTLSYGPVLPVPEKTADGSMFFLTASYVDPTTSPTNPAGAAQTRTPGLHIFSFQQDTSSTTLGDQVGQQWKQVSSLQTYVALSGDTMTGSLTTPSPLRVTQDNALAQRILLGNQQGGGASKPAVIEAQDGAFTLFHGSDWATGGSPIVGSTFSINASINAGLQFRGGQVWHANNDGAGSGLDADLLDGQDGSYYLNTSNQSGIIPLARGGTAVTTTVQGGIVYGGAGQLATSAAGSAGQLLQSGGAGSPSWINASALQVASASQLTTARNITLTGNATGTTSFNGTTDANINVTVVDSQKLGGFLPSFAAGANTVVVRDGSNYSFFGYINSTTSNNENPSISQILVTNGTDNFYRKASIAHLQNSIGLGNYVVKSGDSMTGPLNVNGINLIYSTNSINVPGSGTFGSVTVSGAGTFGSVNASGAGTFGGEVIAYASDGRLKKNVTVIQNAMEKICTLGGYSYDWDMEKTRRLGFYPSNEHEHGLIAQEVQKVLPDAVCAAPFNSEYLTVKYERMVALLVAGMNEQQGQINALMQEVEELKNQR